MSIPRLFWTDRGEGNGQTRQGLSPLTLPTRTVGSLSCVDSQLPPAKPGAWKAMNRSKRF